MVRTSGIREKFRSNALNQLKQERGMKRSRQKLNEEVDSDSEEEDHHQRQSKQKCSNSLISMLPKPKNGNAFGPTVRLENLLKMPERAKGFMLNDEENETVQKEDDNGVVEFNVNKILREPVISSIKDSLQQETSKVVVPKGKEKQKNQITYLAQLSKATEAERKDQAAQGKFNKAAARAKYGW